MIQDYDFAILDWMQDALRSDFLDFLMPKITLIGEHGIFYIAVGILLVFFRRYRRAGITILSGLTIGYVLVNLIVKNLVARARPFQINTAVELLIKAPRDYSFPSGHALHGFMFATVLMFYDKRLGIPAMIAAVLVSFSRLYLYVHFPTDVLAGALMGIGIGVGSYYLVKYVIESIESRRKNRLNS